MFRIVYTFLPDNPVVVDLAIRLRPLLGAPPGLVTGTTRWIAVGYLCLLIVRHLMI